MKFLFAVALAAMIAGFAPSARAAETLPVSPMPANPEEVIDAAMAAEANKKKESAGKAVKKSSKKKPKSAAVKKVKKKQAAPAPKYDRYKY